MSRLGANREWLKTDDLQWRKKIREKEYLLIEVRLAGDGYVIVSGRIDIEDYDDEEIESYISMYGYSSIDEVSKIYDEPNGIIAECIFKSVPSFDLVRIKTCETEEEAEEYVERYIGEDRKKEVDMMDVMYLENYGNLGDSIVFQCVIGNVPKRYIEEASQIDGVNYSSDRFRCDVILDQYGWHIDSEHYCELYYLDNTNTEKHWLSKQFNDEEEYDIIRCCMENLSSIVCGGK